MKLSKEENTITQKPRLIGIPFDAIEIKYLKLVLSVTMDVFWKFGIMHKDESTFASVKKKIDEAAMEVGGYYPKEERTTQWK